MQTSIFLIANSKKILQKKIYKLEKHNKNELSVKKNKKIKKFDKQIL